MALSEATLTGRRYSTSHVGDSLHAFDCRRYLQDVFKVSGKQVSPTEIENTIREHPSQFVTDVVVAGVKGGRLADELVPRAWIVLSNTGKAQGTDAVLAALDQWTRTRLSKHKWLRGGFQVVDEVSGHHRHVGR